MLPVTRMSSLRLVLHGIDCSLLRAVYWTVHVLPLSNECRSCIGFCVAQVAEPTVLDLSCVTTIKQSSCQLPVHYEGRSIPKTHLICTEVSFHDNMVPILYKALVGRAVYPGAQFCTAFGDFWLGCAFPQVSFCTVMESMDMGFPFCNR